MSGYNKENIERVREIKNSLTLIFLLTVFFLLMGMEIRGVNLELKYFLEIIHRDSQERLFSVQVYPEEKFYLEYTNSRDLNPIIDVFQVGSEGSLHLIEERYPWYGVGQECHPSKEIFFKDGMVVVKMNQKMRELPIRVAYTVKQILRIRDQEYPLHLFADSGKPLTILITIQGGHEKSE